MTSAPDQPLSFAFLAPDDPALAQLGAQAAAHCASEPRQALAALRTFGDVATQVAAARLGAFRPDEPAFDRLRRLEDEGLLPPQAAQVLDELRRLPVQGPAANAATARAGLDLARQAGLWLHRTFVEPGFAGVAADGDAGSAQGAGDAPDAALALEQRLAIYQAAATGQAQGGKAQPGKAQQQAQALQAAAGIVLDEAATRRLIDAQLRQAGWQADTQHLRYGTGARPQKGLNLAIAEWPTAHGPADYVLFAGLTPLAIVEAKRQAVNIPSVLEQARRYSRDFTTWENAEPVTGAGTGAATGWNGCHIPFLLATNGRPYLRQLETHSGIWFQDVRHPANQPRALQRWYTPDGLTALLKQDPPAADARLAQEPVRFDFDLRPYQRDAIGAVEAALAQGQRRLLVAMATGTGKTKLAIALIYRLLRAQRFRRVLFLVDRSALGEQAANAFKDTRMENQQTFADIFGIKELEDVTPDAATSVHIATVQGMVQRILYAGAGEGGAGEDGATEDGTGDGPPPIDAYDCIVVDECHRGYLLDRELDSAELTFRSYDDYISKYRRVIDYFDAVKIGLTATPALHTVDIFGPPVFTYTYRDAVLDGYLVDHEPPIQLTTELAANGITWAQGETVEVYVPQTGTVDTITLPDTVTIEVEGFNKQVITENFNRVVCDYLAAEIDPEGRQKTLIFCANDAHAELVVTLLSAALAARYPGIDADTVKKITGAAHRPLDLIRRYKNERLPLVAVTVDLLTTGVDVPPICTLVFLRRVNSRILFEQMLGRATRPCPAVGKECFRIIDAVQLYTALQRMTDMQPVAATVTVPFAQLVQELATVPGEAERQVVLEQFIARLQRQRRGWNDAARDNFEQAAGMPADDFVRNLRQLPLEEVGAWFAHNPGLGEVLDAIRIRQAQPVPISAHPDFLKEVSTGYGDGQKPDDYLHALKLFIDTHRDTVPALVTLLNRPQTLTRQELRELQRVLDTQGFSETQVASAWRETHNQAEFVAHLIGYIRTLALDEPLLPYDQRVEQAKQKLLQSRPWTTPQREWIKRIAAQTKANQIVDRAALDDPDQLFRQEGGGFERLNRLFNNELEQVLSDFNAAIWEEAA